MLAFWDRGQGFVTEVRPNGVLGSSPRIHGAFIPSSYHALMERTGQKVRSAVQGDKGEFPYAIQTLRNVLRGGSDGCNDPVAVAGRLKRGTPS
jgi:hypothetical protein